MSFSFGSAQQNRQCFVALAWPCLFTISSWDRYLVSSRAEGRKEGRRLSVRSSCFFLSAKSQSPSVRPSVSQGAAADIVRSFSSKSRLAALETEEMARGCSYCGHHGHNSRTCPDRGVRLFGVRLTDGVMRKSMSMSNLSHYASANNPPSPPEQSGSGATPDGYVSDGLVQTSNNARERKKGK
jgi:hypothetical protein